MEKNLEEIIGGDHQKLLLYADFQCLWRFLEHHIMGFLSLEYDNSLLREGFEDSLATDIILFTWIVFLQKINAEFEP